MRSLGRLLSRIRHRLRLYRLNRTAGIEIALSTHIATTARIEAVTDGGWRGGRIVIADGVIISEGAIIAAYGGAIEIATNAYIGPYCVLYGHGGLTIGRNSMIAAHTVIVPANHGFGRLDLPIREQPLTMRGISIGEDVWIGSGCQVLDGVRIGNGAVIGAGSVVTRAIDAGAVAFGAPAAAVRNRRDAGAAGSGM